jgi:hypothetical protein
LGGNFYALDDEIQLNAVIFRLAVKAPPRGLAGFQPAIVSLDDAVQSRRRLVWANLLPQSLLRPRRAGSPLDRGETMSVVVDPIPIELALR